MNICKIVKKNIIFRQKNFAFISLTFLLMNSLVLIQGQANKRKIDSNSDNYIIIYYKFPANGLSNYAFDESNNYNKGNRDFVSYLKVGETIINKDANNKFDSFQVYNGTKVEIHLSSCVTNLDGFFSYDNDHSIENINSVDFTYFDSSCLESTKSLFFEMRNLETINFSNFKTTKVKDMEFMFYYCRGLKSLDLSTFDTSSTTSMRGMFMWAYNLEIIDLSSFNTSSVVLMSEMFYQCSQLKSLDLSNFDTSKVTNMDNMFYNLQNLEVLDLSNFYISSTVSMNSFINQTFAIKVLNLSRAYLLEISESKTEYMISNLRYMKNVDISSAQVNDFFINKFNMYMTTKNKNVSLCYNNDMSLISRIDQNLKLCCEYDLETDICDSSNYIKAYFESNVEYNDGFGNDYRINIGYLKYEDSEYTRKNTITIEPNNPLEIKYAFPIDNLNNFFVSDSNMDSLISIDFSNFDSSKITSTENLFLGLTKLKSVYLANFGSSSLTNMKGMFKDCNSLELVDFTNFQSSAVTTMESMFENCATLESFDLSKMDINALTNIESLFKGCNSLKILDFSYLNMDHIHSASNMFDGLTNLDYIILTNTALSNEIFSEIKNKLNDKYYHLICSKNNIEHFSDYQCCNAETNTNCFKCIDDDNYIIIVGKISLLNDREELFCSNIDMRNLFLVKEGENNYIKKCEESITNCEECSEGDHCTKCKDDYGTIDNVYNECKEVSGDKYYYDSDLGTYKLCSYKIANCETCYVTDVFICKSCEANYTYKHENNIIGCELKSNLKGNKHYYSNDSETNYYSCKTHNVIENCDECSNKDTCDKCPANHIYKHENNIKCVEKSDLEGDKHFYKDESETNYYSCKLYNNIKNCEECSNKDTCDKCESGYEINKNKQLCVRLVDIQNNLYIKNNDGLLITCSSLINNCNRCNDSQTCLECQDGFGLIDNNTCLIKEVLEGNQNYFIDKETKKYISCSIMEHCITCNSSSVCTSCKEGFILENDKCKNPNEGKDKGLSGGAIAGIVIGCLGFISISTGIGYYIFKYILPKKSISNGINNGDISKIKNDKAKIQKQQKVKENGDRPPNTEKDIINSTNAN